MRLRGYAAVALSAVLLQPGFAKKKDPPTLPPYLLQARTAVVIIDPEAGVDPTDPRANQVARSDVEAALQNWGRLQPVISLELADVVIVVRRGHGRAVEPTLSDPGQNRRGGMTVPSDEGVGIGVQRGTPYGQPQNLPPVPQGPNPRVEAGGAEDSFVVYEGKVVNPLDAVAGWRYVAKDGLKAHAVPAVGEFRKALDAADKAAAAAKKP